MPQGSDYERFMNPALGEPHPEKLYCARCDKAREIKSGDDERLLLSCGHVAVYETDHGTWDVN